MLWVAEPVRSSGAELANAARDHHVSGMTNFELSDEETAVLTGELTDITWTDRYPLSPRVQTLKAILGKLKPKPPRPAAAPEPRAYAPPAKGRYRRRG